MLSPYIQNVCLKGASRRAKVIEASDAAIDLEGWRVEEFTAKQTVELGTGERFSLEGRHFCSHDRRGLPVTWRRDTSS